MNGSHDRDQDLERLLRQSLKTPRGGDTTCVDPETLAAWVEGGLSAHELQIAQSHVADCARCQATLAALIQTTPSERVIPMSELSADESAPQARRRWLVWFAPLAAAAAAVAIWVAAPRGPGHEPQQVAGVQVLRDQASAPEAPSAAAQRQQAPAAKAEQGAAPKSDRPRREQAQESALKKDTERPERDLLKQEPAATDAAGARTNTDRAAVELAAPAAAAPSAAPPQAALEARQAFQQSSANGATFRSRSTAPHWRIAGTAFERSFDDGLTWTAVATGVDGEWTALSSPSPNICWVVGRRGVVLRTVDGQNFLRVAFPETTDLSAVQANDAQTAIVTEQGGRSFATADGGATWHSAP